MHFVVWQPCCAIQRWILSRSVLFLGEKNRSLTNKLSIPCQCKEACGRRFLDLVSADSMVCCRGIGIGWILRSADEAHNWHRRRAADVRSVGAYISSTSSKMMKDDVACLVQSVGSN